MTYAQIGATPHKPCCHTAAREGCIHCAHSESVEADFRAPSSGTIKTSEASR